MNPNQDIGDNQGETSGKPARKAGNNGNVLPDTPKPFTKDNQPSPEAKKQGWARKKMGTELAREIFNLPFVGMKDSQLRKSAAEYYNIDEEDITVEMMMMFRQIEKAIQKADTYAFSVIMDRAHGKPKQDIKHDGELGVHILISNEASKLGDA